MKRCSLTSLIIWKIQIKIEIPLHIHYNGYYKGKKAKWNFQKIPSVGKDVEKLEPLYVTAANVKWYSWMWELDYKESWALKNWCFWTVLLEKTLEILLDSKDIQSVYPKGDQSWVFIGRTDAKAETPILWPPDAKSDSLEKILMLGMIEGQRRRGWQRMRWFDGIPDLMDMSLSKFRDLVMDRKTWCAAVHEVTKSWTWLSNWTELNTVKSFSVVNEAKVDDFLEFSCFFYDPANVDNLISSSSAFFKFNLNI